MVEMVKIVKIKPDEVCAWCGTKMYGRGSHVADDHICLRCYRNHVVEKGHWKTFWKGVLGDGPI